MIKIYISPSCASCRKVKSWFNKEKIPYQEINIFKSELTENDLQEMLEKSLDGTDEIISTRSKIFKEQNIDVNSMSIKQLLSFIKKNPSILKRPIIVDDTKIQVGYNSDEIEIFEREKKNIAIAKQLAKETCINCCERETCMHRYDDTKRTIEKELHKTEVCNDCKQ